LAKILLLAIVVAAVYFVLRGYARSIGRKDKVDAGTDIARGEDMVRCRHCGVHLPRSESVMVLGEHYCSEEHGSSNGRH
jgi:uncharacterized protein